MRLYTYFLSSASYRVRIALNLKSLDYEPYTQHLRHKDHRSAQYLALNPQGLLPALEHDGRVIPQSLAIIEYLEELHPVPSLLPGAAPEPGTLHGTGHRLRHPPAVQPARAHAPSP